MKLLDWSPYGVLPVGGGGLLVRGLAGNRFGLASELLGMQRLVWAWPVGIGSRGPARRLP